MYEPEIIEVDSTNVACDGGGGALGHPRVWLPVGASGQVTCPYCSRIFVYRSDESAEDEVETPPPDCGTPSDTPAAHT